MLRRLPQPVMPQLGVVVVSIAALAASSHWLESNGTLSLSRTEIKYPQVAGWFSAHTTPETVVLASLHSGSIHYYSGRLTLRWDAIPSDRLVPTLAGLAARGTPAYVVLDDDYEHEQFDRRFAGVVGTGVRVQPVAQFFKTIIATIESR